MEKTELVKIKRMCIINQICEDCPFYDCNGYDRTDCTFMNNLPLDWDLKEIRKKLKILTGG